MDSAAVFLGLRYTFCYVLGTLHARDSSGCGAQYIQLCIRSLATVRYSRHLRRHDREVTYGFRSSLPVVLRPSMSVWALATSSSG